jgi:hypothetical protein
MLNLANAVVYDIETFPNAFTFAAEALNSDWRAVWEISAFRDDRRELMQYLQHLGQTQTPMIGFNNLHFDYPVIHALFQNPMMGCHALYEKAMEIITGNPNDKFGQMIWADNRFAPQIDLFKIHHMDNKAKSTSLKMLQINMRTDSVVDMPVEVGTVLTPEQVNTLLVPYNYHDVYETKKFAKFSAEAIEFRLGLIPQFGVDVMNWPDTKIGSKMIESRLGDELLYDRSSGRRRMIQTPRTRIALNDIIFPYIQFEHPEFNRILNYLRGHVLTASEIDELTKGEYAAVQTKGVFTDLKANVGGIDFYFGTGGIHGSVASQRIVATEEWLIRDIDVASLYPSIAIVNRLAPAHLGAAFVEVYSEFPKERKKWQAEKGKKCIEANTLKLASNGVYGNSNNMYSPFYDPQFTLTITVNGQLMLCMLAERLLKVPTLKIIQINTDGITYFVHRDYEPQAKQFCKEWEALTCLVLEDANYKRMWIRDVNNYVAESMDGSLKTKGAYWAPDPLNYHTSVANAQPPAWHKDLGNVISIRAAVAAMVHGVEPELFIRLSTNPFDFMCRAKVQRSDTLLYGGQPIQKNSRYYVSTDGENLIKRSPSSGPEGAFKRAAKVSEEEYQRVMKEVNWAWDARVCTKNKSTYEKRESAFTAGYKVSICNDMRDFSFYNVNYEWYIQEARKLIV